MVDNVEKWWLAQETIMVVAVETTRLTWQRDPHNVNANVEIRLGRQHSVAALMGDIRTKVRQTRRQVFDEWLPFSRPT